MKSFTNRIGRITTELMGKLELTELCTLERMLPFLAFHREMHRAPTGNREQLFSWFLCNWWWKRNLLHLQNRVKGMVKKVDAQPLRTFWRHAYSSFGSAISGIIRFVFHDIASPNTVCFGRFVTQPYTLIFNLFPFGHLNVVLIWHWADIDTCFGLLGTSLVCRSLVSSSEILAVKLWQGVPLMSSVAGLGTRK